MQQFKVKSVTKRSSINVIPSNAALNSYEKKSQLCLNNDFINVQDNPISEQAVVQSVDLVTRNPPTLLRNQSLRPRSGVSRNIVKNPKIKQNKTDEEIIKQRIKQKILAANIGDRPSTSGNSQTGGLRYEKHQKLMKRRTTNNSNNTLSGFGQRVNKTIVENQTLDIRSSSEEEQTQIQCLSNEQVLTIMQQIIDNSAEYYKLRASNEQQFMKIRQKLISNVSIIVLKWYKILQDQLFHQVKRLGAKYQGEENSKQLSERQQKIPESIDELVQIQVRKQFSIKNGLFAIEQRCSSQQNKLSMLIDGRLQRLQSLLVQSTTRSTMQKC